MSVPITARTTDCESVGQSSAGRPIQSLSCVNSGHRCRHSSRDREGAVGSRSGRCLRQPLPYGCGSERAFFVERWWRNAVSRFLSRPRRADPIHEGISRSRACFPLFCVAGAVVSPSELNTFRAPSPGALRRGMKNVSNLTQCSCSSMHRTGLDRARSAQLSLPAGQRHAPALRRSAAGPTPGEALL